MHRVNETYSRDPVADDSYVTEGNERKMRENEAQMEGIKQEIVASNAARATLEASLAALADELSRQNSVKTNISSNLRYRKAERDIAKVQEELDTIDLEQLAKSRREFNTKYREKLDQESETQNAWQRASGILVGLTANREKLQKTLDTDYKDIKRLFKEQMIKVKVSETANNDLEKYGKALDKSVYPGSFNLD